jgi:RimJ/RimL family protein N-acetyltransferase
MEDQNMIHVLAFADGKLAGSATINRDLKGRKRTYHQAAFGITIAREFRTIGLGEVLARAVIDEARAVIPGLRIITLSVYSLNAVAQSL